MRAWQIVRAGPAGAGPMELVDLDVPVPGAGELLVEVRACGVCRTDLHIAEGDLPLVRERVVPGHEVAGRVIDVGGGVDSFVTGDRVGIAWLRRTCGRCRYCARGAENVCARPRFTGYTDDGGYAEYAMVHGDYAYRLPESFDDEHAAPLLCAGIIGYRALRRARVPAGGKLGIYGFGGSAHIACQVAVYEGADVYVVTRSEGARRLALDLGARWAGAGDPPVPLDAAILFAPAGELVPVALAHLDRGATLALAGIHLTPIPGLDLDRHLSGERTVTSVTANTRADGRELLDLAARIPITTTTQPYPLGAADRALADLAGGRVRGAAVLLPGAE